MPNRHLEALYPELTRSGRLADALQSSLDVLGSRLKVQDPLGGAYATVRVGNRSCQAMLASEKLAEVFIAAAHTPLRSLMPFTSHSRACFSTRTGFPYTHDCPMIEVLRTGACHVFAPGALGGASPIFSGSVDEAVTNAVAALPSTMSVARDGTADDDAA